MPEVGVGAGTAIVEGILAVIAGHMISAVLPPCSCRPRAAPPSVRLGQRLGRRWATQGRRHRSNTPHWSNRCGGQDEEEKLLVEACKLFDRLRHNDYGLREMRSPPPPHTFLRLTFF